MAHKHDHCSHELMYCEKCDVVYCKKCDREWGRHAHGWYYRWPNWYDTTPNYQPTYMPNTASTVYTTGGTSSDTVSGNTIVSNDYGLQVKDRHGECLLQA